MMAYKPPPELRNRIESIKRKFEIVEPEKLQLNTDNSQVPLIDNDRNSRSECRNAVSKKVSSPLIATKAVYTENTNFEKSKDKIKATCSHPGKGNIRRTPAFRCDKSLLSHQSSNVDKKSHSVVNNRVKMFEDRRQSNTDNASFAEKGTEKCVVEAKGKESSYSKPKQVVNVGFNSTGSVNGNSSVSNVSKYKNAKFTSFPIIEGRTSAREKYVNDRKVSNGSETKSNESTLHRKGGIIQRETRAISREKSSVGKHLATEEVPNALASNLTCSLRAALKAPLPPGPPPKKPPRTFVHNSPDVRGRSVCSMITTEKCKTESCLSSDLKVLGNRKNAHVLERSTTEPHIMLKKLENVLLKHQQGIGSVVITPRAVGTEIGSEKQQTILGTDMKRDFNKQTMPFVPLPDSTEASHGSKEVDETVQYAEKLSGGCFESLNCVSNIPKHLYEKLNEPRSEFFVESPLCPRRKNSASATKNGSEQTRKSSLGKSACEEHIYAEPYACVDVETILKADLPVKEKKIAENPVISCIQFPKPGEQKSSTLHYMCSPINPLERMDALLNCNNVNAMNNNDDSNSQIEPRESKNKINGNNIEFKSEEMHLPQKSFLHFNPISKNLQTSSANVSIQKLDRNKVQLFINQAFGSPLHDSPVTSLDSTSSDESSPTTPDEMNPPDVHDEEGTSRKKEEGIMASSRQSDTLGENSLNKQDMTKLTEERKVYVRRVSSRVVNTRQRLSSQPFSHLFNCIMLIGLNLDGEKKTKVPYIKSKYPVNASVPPLIEHLCFPDAADWPPRSSSDNIYCDEQSYSLVITNEIGDHMFGYCRRVMPEGMDICLPLAYCILSPYRAKGFYFKILSELESQHGQPEWLQKSFIKELYACEFPNPGQSLKLPNTLEKVPGSVEASLNSLATQIRRPLDSRLEEHDLTLLFSTLPVPILLQVFGSLLLERKVLFISNSLSKLSSCIEALHSILYPFSWQYTFIPVLPSAHIGVCEAPTPFIIGLMKDKVGKALSVSLEEGIIIDLEDSKIVQSVGDESTILPSRLKKCLKMALQLVESTTREMEPARNVLISEAFVRMFVEICGHYTNHIVTQQDGKKVFERESFVKAVPLHSVQLFLEWFTETAMFSSFMESRLNEGSETKGIFEQRALEHTEEMDKNTMLFLRNYKAINKKVKSFGDRLKDWTPFT